MADPQETQRVAHLLGQSEGAGSGGATFSGEPHRDDTLQHPRCVYQVLKRHFARYTPEMVSRVCGMSPGQFRQVAIEARVVVTERMKPLRIAGETIHQVGLPWHWGPNGLVTGDAANEIIGISLDPNVHIMDTKTGTCDVVAGRRPRGPDLLSFVDGYRQRAGLTDGTG